MMNDVNYSDVIIVGGGASGLAAAINIKKENKNATVTVLEQLDRVGKKLILTGNGRCNITNAVLDISRYHGKDVDFASEILENFGVGETQKFFEELGLLITFEENGKGFPLSFQASSVVDALRFECDELGVQTVCGCTVTDFEKKDKVYTVKTTNGTYNCRYLIAAAGLVSGGEKIGSNGKFLRLMGTKGFSVEKLTPAIVQLKTETDVIKPLKGVKINGTVSLKVNGEILRKEYGEILFTEYGISGPPVLQISRGAARNNGEKYAVIDLLPDITFSELSNLLIKRKEMFAKRNVEYYFTGVFNRILGQTLLKKSGVKFTDKCESISNAKVKELTSLIKNFTLKITGDNGFTNSQVTAGGLNTDAFDKKTLESKKYKGLFAIGEILDIDGDCGGFNLQWAWASAFFAAKEISRRINSDTNK